MKNSIRTAVGVGVILLVTTSTVFAQTYTVDQILSNMNQAGKDFPYMEASMEQTKLFRLDKSTDKDPGKIYFGRQGKNPLIKIDYDAPKNSVLVKDGKYSRYYPANNKVELATIGDKSEFLMIVFGQWSDNFKKNFDLKVGGSEVVDGKNTIMLDLIPKNAEVSKGFSSFRLWIDTKQWIAIQTRGTEKGGDIDTMTLTNIIRGKSVKTSIFALDLPKDVQKIKG